MRRLRWLLYLCYGASLLFAVPGAILVAAHETTGGLLAGLCVLSVLALPAMLFARGRTQGRARRGLGIAACLDGVLAAALAVWLAASAPDGRAPGGSRIESLFSGATSFRRWSPANLVPEIDQVKLGIILAAALDPVIDRAQARRITEKVLPFYRDMEGDPRYRALGSAMGYAYSDLLGWAFDSGHAYRYVPARLDARRAPAVVFLHGNAGNFKAYLRAWAVFAERSGSIIVCPSFGFGNWQRPGGVDAVERARELALAAGADPGRVYLAGLSNGGRGVTRAAAANPAAYRGLVFISAVLESEMLSQPAFAEGWKGRPALILHGGKDDRVPERVALDGARQMESAGVRVTLKLLPDEDHFLFLGSLGAVLDTLEAWRVGGER